MKCRRKQIASGVILFFPKNSLLPPGPSVAELLNFSSATVYARRGALGRMDVLQSSAPAKRNCFSAVCISEARSDLSSMFWKRMFLQLTVGYLHGLENGEELQKTMKGLCF